MEISAIRWNYGLHRDKVVIPIDRVWLGGLVSVY